MAGRRSTKLGAIFSAAFALAGLLGSASPSMAQSEGISGFDWIGTDPANLLNQRCYASNIYEDTAFNRTVTAWKPPASGNKKIQWSYSLQNFRAQVGSINYTPSHPADYAGWELYVYDSFDSFRNNSASNFRARFTFDKGSASINYQNSYDCQYYAGGETQGIPCYRLTLDLTHPTAVQYKTASGQVTPVALKLNGGTRYWFSLIGFRSSPSLDVPCVVRTTPGLAQTFSPQPLPAVSFPLTPSQQAESGLPEGVPFTLAHSDFMKSHEGICDQTRTPVNYMAGYSQLPPFLQYTGYGGDPRTCGAPNWEDCCERTQSAHWAKALGVNRIITYTALLSTKAFLVHRVDECLYPNC